MISQYYVGIENQMLFTFQSNFFVITRSSGCQAIFAQPKFAWPSLPGPSLPSQVCPKPKFAQSQICLSPDPYLPQPKFAWSHFCPSPICPDPFLPRNEFGYLSFKIAKFQVKLKKKIEKCYYLQISIQIYQERNCFLCNLSSSKQIIEVEID